ncbi:hypothetical protein ACFWEO_08935 [Streptomyces roseolus]
MWSTNKPRSESKPSWSREAQAERDAARREREAKKKLRSQK